MIRPFWRTSLLLFAVLFVPIVPFLILGASFETELERWFRDAPLSVGARFGLIVAALSVDVFFPVPSSMVSTYGGGILGTWPATAASWLGMTIGAIVGFGLARRFGPRFAARLAGQDDLDRIQRLGARIGPSLLLLTRPLPILAEACVLLMGTTRLGWNRFLAPVLVGNLIVSLSYAACGAYFQSQNALPIAIVVSGAIPLFVALFARRRLSRLVEADQESQAEC